MRCDADMRITSKIINLRMRVVENEISAPIRPDRADNDGTSGQGLLSDDSAIEKYETRVHSHQRSHEQAFRII
jgi:hypothetical protein